MGGGYILPNSQSALMLNAGSNHLPQPASNTLPANSLSSGGILMDSRNTLNSRIEYNLTGNPSASAQSMGPKPQGGAAPK